MSDHGVGIKKAHQGLAGGRKVDLHQLEFDSVVPCIGFEPMTSALQRWRSPI